jgi:2-succinyl-6-hydroxy-2,4-cyclohexadiene-1-carboxylate synthase
MEAFVDHWMGLPLFATQGKLPAQIRAATRETRMKNTPEALAACLRGNGTGAQPSFWEDLESIQIPTLLLAGEEDKKFTDIARKMAEKIVAAELRLIPRAGHSIHLENPFAFLAAVKTYQP